MQSTKHDERGQQISAFLSSRSSSDVGMPAVMIMTAGTPTSLEERRGRIDPSMVQDTGRHDARSTRLGPDLQIRAASDLSGHPRECAGRPTLPAPGADEVDR